MGRFRAWRGTPTCWHFAPSGIGGRTRPDPGWRRSTGAWLLHERLIGENLNRDAGQVAWFLVSDRWHL